MTIDIKFLDTVIEQTIMTVEKSREQIFDIAEQARKECEHLRQEVDRLQSQVDELILYGEEQEKKLKQARLHLSKVSKNFQIYTEEDIREAYERANQIQLEQILTAEKEKQLRKTRDELQRRLKNLELTVEKAENLITQMSVVLGYLTGDIRQVGRLLEDTEYKYKVGLKILHAQEEERKRVAREIHDGPAQSMANAILRAEIAEKVLLQEGVERAKAELKELKGSIRDSLADVRRIIFDLRPMALDDLGLVPTVEKYIDGLTKKTTTKIQFMVRGLIARLPSALEVVLFRLIQESLTNIIKHAKASTAKVMLEFRQDFVHLLVEDDGIGFEFKDRSQLGYGLMGMKERVKLLRGEIKIATQPGRGTTICVHIPIEIKEGEGEKDEQDDSYFTY